MAGWNYNPYLKPEDQKSKTPWIKEEAPDVLGVLSKERWITNEEAREHYISTLLGWLEESEQHYKFKYSTGWGEWPEDYLNSVISHGLSLRMLKARQRWEAEKGGGKAPSAPLPPLELQKAIDKKRAFHESMSKNKSNAN